MSSCSQPSPNSIDFSAIPPATTPLEANDPARFRQRADVVISFAANHRLPGEFMGGEVLGEDSVVNAIARLELGGHSCADILSGPRLPFPFPEPTSTREPIDNLRVVNEVLARTRVHAKVGTDFTDFGFDRKGDWDTVLKGLVLMLYRYNSKLDPDVYAHVLHQLLDQRGPRPADADWVDGIRPLTPHETENHILMIESSRYLTNQLLYLEAWQSGRIVDLFDNHMNGMDEWMLRHLKSFLQHDFWEFNSRPYQRYSMAALQNVYDFSWNDHVKRAARMVLDNVSAKTAVSSNGLRRAVPFRRLKGALTQTELFGWNADAQTARMVILSGLTQQLPGGHADAYAEGMFVPTALTTYRVPEMILDILMDKTHNAYYQQFHHGDHDGIPGGIEIYASSSNFLLSAGGVWLPSGNGDYDELLGYRDNAYAIPTTVMPTRRGSDRADFLRIDGSWLDRGRINTGVLPHFACGLNINIPIAFGIPPTLGGLHPIDKSQKEAPEQCMAKQGNWTFINASGSCRNPHNDLGFYAAVFVQDCQTKECTQAFAGFPINALNFGFLEVAPSEGMTFRDFQSRVLQSNAHRTFSSEGINIYTTIDGRRIQFTPNPSPDKYRWGILSVNDQAFDTNIHNWPLARGDIINTVTDTNDDGHSGMVTVDNPFMQQRLVMDMRDPTIPRRYQFRVNAPRHTAGALVSRDVFRLDAFWSGPDGTVNRIAWDAYVHGGSYWGFPAALTRPMYIARASPLVSISRTSESADLFWLGGDGSIWSSHWNSSENGGEWTRPFRIPIADPAGKVARHSGLATVARKPDHIDLFWIAEDGKLWTHWRNKEFPGGDWDEHNAYAITPPGDAAPASNIVAIAPNSEHLDVFWTDAAGTVRTIFWDNGHWGGLGTVSNRGEAAAGCSLTANARNPSQTDLFWISPNGAIRGTWRHPAHNNGDWNTVYEIAPADSAFQDAGLASVSRVPNQVDVYWITTAGAVVGRYWNDNARPLGWIAFEAASDGSAHIDSLLHAVSRDPETIDLVWTGPDQQLRAHWWKGVEGGSWSEHASRDLTPPRSVRLRKQDLNPRIE